MATGQGIKAGEGYVLLGVDDGPLVKGLRDAASRVQSFGAKIAGVGAGIAGVGASILTALTPGVVSYASYEQALADLRAAANPTAEAFERIKEQVGVVARSTGTSGVQVITMYSELIKAGAKVEDVLNGMGEAAVQFAYVGGMEMAETAKILWGTMNLFSQEGLNATQVMNLMARADGASATSLRAVAEAFGTGAGALADYGQTLETTSALVAILGNNLIEGANAGTLLRVMFTRLAVGGDGVEGALEELGIGMRGLRNDAGVMLPAVEIIDKLQTALSRFGQADQERLTNALAGERGGRALGVILRGGVAEFERMRNEMRGSLSVSERFNIMQDTLKNALAQTMVYVAGLANTVGSALAPTLRGVFNILLPLISAVDAFAKENKSVVLWVGVAAAAVFGLGSAIAALGAAFWLAGGAASTMLTAIVLVKSAILSLVAVVFVLLNPLILLVALAVAVWAAWFAIVGVLVAVGARLAYTSGLWAGIASAASLAWETIKEIFYMIVEGWRRIIANLFSAGQATNFWQYLVDFWAGTFLPMLGRVASLASGAASSIAAAFGEAFSYLSATFSDSFGSIYALLTAGEFALAWDIFAATAAVAWEVIKMNAEIVWIELKFAVLRILDEIGLVLTNVFADIWLGMKVGFLASWSAIKAVFFDGMALIAETRASVTFGEESRQATEAAVAFRAAAINERNGVGGVNDAIAESNAAWWARQIAAVNMEMQLEADREAALGGLDGGALGEAQQRLEAARQAAIPVGVNGIFEIAGGGLDFGAIAATVNRARPGQAPAGSEGSGGIAGSSVGTFSAAAIGFMSGAVNPMKRTEDLLGQNNGGIKDVVNLLENMPNVMRILAMV